MSEYRITGMECGRRDVATLAHALPGDRPRWPRDRAVDVEHIKLEVTLDAAAKAVAGTATHTVTPFSDGLRSMEFDAVDMEISGVSVNEAPAKFSYDGARLRVVLGATRRRGEPLTIAIAYRARPRIGLYFVGDDPAYPEKPAQVWSQGQDEDSRFWFPCYDHPNEKQTSEMVVTALASWSVLSNGALVSERANADGTRTFHWRQERPHSTYLITLVAGEFERIDASREGLTIDYYVEAKDAESGAITFANTPKMVALFERLTSVPYPWAKYSQVVVRDFVFGGMENTSATTMTENILLDRKAMRDYSSDPLISHELAHMWWGDLLTCRDWSHGWLNESFATFFEFLWDEEAKGIDEYRQGVIENTRLYLEERYRRPIVTNVFNEPIDIFDRHLYEKGSLVLNTLRGVLGEDAFLRSIQRYCRENQERSVITQDLVAAIAAETGRDLEWFFDQWVYRPGHPEFKVSWSWDDERKLASVSVKQTQEGDAVPQVFRAPLTIDFQVGRSKPVAFAVEVTEREQTLVFALAKQPDLCRFDPYNMVLKQLDFEKSTGELRLQLRDDDSIAGRQAAAEALGKKGGPEAVAALEDALMADRFWGAQAAAAKALGAERSESAKAALLRSLGVKHPKARRGVVAALGEFRGDEGVLAAISPLAGRDQSWFVEAEANRSVGKLRCRGSFAVIVANLERPSYRQLVRNGCIDGLVELREERGLELIAAAARYGAPEQSRAVAVGALARLGQHFEGRAKSLADDLTNFLDDRDFRVRMAAANGLKKLKDPSFAPALDRMAERELDGRSIRVAREAALVLRKGAETTEEVRRLRDDFERLRDENVRLKDRLAKLETVKR
ncbi:MAG: M1 family aminopeptidase [Tepidiformaceae bacterium]